MTATHLECELDDQHEKAVLALVNEAHRIDVQRLRETVLAACGTVADRYWAVAALSCAQLAISYPHLYPGISTSHFSHRWKPRRSVARGEGEALHGLAA
jgi:hypothetical protein